MGHTILITGSSGFLGSILCVALSRYHTVIGFDIRPPQETLRQSAPGTIWCTGDIRDADCIDDTFKRQLANGNAIDYIIHFADFTGFGAKWQDQYCDINVIGTRNIINTALRQGVKRILFAGSIAALEPVPPGHFLTERSPAEGTIAYTKSKIIGEKLLADVSKNIPVIVLRIGGVFTDWCELPPLFSLIKLWSNPVTRKLMPGKGKAGFPYIHRRDVASIVKKIIEKDLYLDAFEILFASQSGCTSQNQLFPVIQKALGQSIATPVHIPPPVLKTALHAKLVLNTLLGRPTYERAWMANYLDRPLVVDTTYTRNKIDWEPTPGLGILERLPVLIKQFKSDPQTWSKRNIKRNDQKYDYHPDALSFFSI